MNRKRIFIVDNNAGVRGALAKLIDHEKDLEVCGQAGSGREAVLGIRSTHPHVAIVDPSLEDMNGIELIRKIRSGKAAPEVLVVSMHDEHVFSEEALAAGARGYLAKTTAAGRILDALRTVAEGKRYP